MKKHCSQEARGPGAGLESQVSTQSARPEMQRIHCGNGSGIQVLDSKYYSPL